VDQEQAAVDSQGRPAPDRRAGPSTESFGRRARTSRIVASDIKDGSAEIRIFATISAVLRLRSATRRSRSAPARIESALRWIFVDLLQVQTAGRSDLSASSAGVEGRDDGPVALDPLREGARRRGPGGCGDGDPGEEPRAIGHKVNDYMQDVFPRLALSEFLKLKREQNASLRDRARAQHGKFGRKDLKLLRDNFLTSSLDTSSIARDIGSFKAGSGRFTSALFYGEPAPWMRRSNSEQSDGDEREDFLNKLSEQQEKVATELVVFDADYRDILSTVASIGSSIYAFRVQRYAMAIAVLSIFIAVIALLSDDARAALGATVWGWLIAVWPWD
jgi:hypothetical protein